MAYLTWSALSNSDHENDPLNQCNAFYDSNKTLAAQIAVNTILFCITLCYVSYATSDTTSEKVRVGNLDVAAQVLDDTKEDDDPDPEEEGQDEDDVEKQQVVPK